ncbi:hypothetical protein [Kordiimonas pumila]|uniref:Uncharacterized protein n=1 Tax=Kordiimonas pumila TaxID=2161677 RepID=A0ABV7D499_9PROT|nr:hypothetical protein [Kordiimonas pumila]
MIFRTSDREDTGTSPLGTGRFGQTGNLPDLYRTYRLDDTAIIDAAAELFLEK